MSTCDRSIAWAITTFAVYMSSATLIPERYELSLMTVVHWLNSAGMIVLNVCGRMM